MILYPITIPGGSDTQVQYNNGGIFGGDSTFTFNDSTKMITGSGLTLNGSQTYGIDLSGGTWSTGVLNLNQPFDVFSNGTRCMYLNDTSAIAVFGMGDAGNIDSITSGTQISAFGSKVFRNVTTGGNLVGMGTLAGAAIVNGTNVVAIGPSSLQNSVTPSGVISIGGLSLNQAYNYLRSVVIGVAAARYAGAGGSGAYDLTIIGDNAAYGTAASTFYETTAIGAQSGYRLTTGGKRDILIGFKSGTRQTTLNDRLIIDSRDRGSAAAELTDSLIYGIMDATPASQSLRFNIGNLYLGNPTHSDADGGGAIIQSFIREDGSGTASTAATITSSHDGAGADDTDGKLVLATNLDGTGLVDHVEIDSAGATKIGDAGTTNYAQFAVDGELTLAGTARVIKHINVPIEGANGASAPTVRTSESPYLAWTFATNDDSEHTLLVPPDMDFTEPVNIYVRWYTSVSQVDDEVNWQLEWNARAVGETVNAGSTTDSSGDVNCPAQWVIAETLVDTVPANSMANDDEFGLDLKRIAIVDGTNPAVGSIHVLGFHVEYTSNKLGEAT
jgi:hypothetical protein